MIGNYIQLKNRELNFYNEELIYERYCEVYPEKITSDFSLEEASEELEDFVRDYMSKELEGNYGK